MEAETLPFRPRAAVHDAAYEDIARQASEGRRRINLVAVLHAACVGFSALVLSAGLLIELASHLSTKRFAMATWTLVAIAVVIAASAALRLWRFWLRDERAPIAIDHRAGLEDRLATFLHAGDEAQRSRLWDHLARENVELKPRWTPKTLVPHLAPPSLGLVLFALFVAAITAWRSPLLDKASGAYRRPPASAGQPPNTDPGESESAGEEPPSSGADESRWSAIPRQLQQAVAGPQTAQEVSGSAPKKTAPVDDEKPGSTAIVDQGMKSSGPKQSQPATPDASQKAGAPSGSPSNPTQNQPNPSAKSGADTSAPVPASPIKGDAPKTLAPDKGKLQSPEDKKLDKKQPSPTGLGGSGSAGAGSGGDKDGLFGEKQAAGGAAGSFSLDLDVSASDDPGPEKGEDVPRRVDSALGANQRVDDAIRRAQVPAEYETIVQRLFNRSADDSDRSPSQR